MQSPNEEKPAPNEFLAFCADMGRGLFGMGRSAAVASVSAAERIFAAICSLLVPGFGQLIQGRFGAAAAFLFFGLVLWAFLLGWIIHILAAADALFWAPRRAPPS